MGEQWGPLWVLSGCPELSPVLHSGLWTPPSSSETRPLMVTDFFRGLFGAGTMKAEDLQCFWGQNTCPTPPSTPYPHRPCADLLGDFPPMWDHRAPLGHQSGAWSLFWIRKIWGLVGAFAGFGHICSGGGDSSTWHTMLAGGFGILLSLKSGEESLSTAAPSPTDRHFRPVCTLCSGQFCLGRKPRLFVPTLL